MSEQATVRMVATSNFIRAGKRYEAGCEYDIPVSEAASLDGWLMAAAPAPAKEEKKEMKNGS